MSNRALASFPGSFANRENEACEICDDEAAWDKGKNQGRAEQERPGSGAPAVYFGMGNTGGQAQTIQRYRYPMMTAVRV